MTSDPQGLESSRSRFASQAAQSFPYRSRANDQLVGSSWEDGNVSEQELAPLDHGFSKEVDGSLLCLEATEDQVARLYASKPRCLCSHLCTCCRSCPTKQPRTQSTNPADDWTEEGKTDLDWTDQDGLGAALV